MTTYENEGELQALVVESPELVGAPASVVALREFALPNAGYLDVLLIDLDGAITLVEAKLNRNPEIRRAVVGQLLGYAGGLWGMSYDMLDSVVRSRTGSALAELARAVAGEENFEPDDFRARLATNLTDGVFRLVFAVDEITEDLKRAVEYLNAHTTSALEVIVLEFRYAKVEGVEILPPNTFGEESARRKQSARSSVNRWSESTFFDAVEERAAAEERRLLQTLYDWAAPRVSYFYWGEGNKPACTFVFEAPEGAVQPCRIVVTEGGIVVRVAFGWARKRPRVALEAMLDRLTELPGFAAVREEVLAADFRKHPGLPITEYGDEGIQRLTRALEALLEHPPEA
ncbi:hypothetical protein [Egicoccus sp. AB-alg2]|uniref:hypothetical protein n=1 Tax=Egicoccus sp. AB-alg2 TaxID=3242693 RepID=UPI00359D5D2F